MEQQATSFFLDTDDPFSLSGVTRRAEADQYRALGEERHAAGDVEDAAAYYEMSLEIYPTAEAHTCLAWALAARKQWDAAIAECERAIALDPELGNPYNDTGVYLIEQDKIHEAMPFLEKAIVAPRYDCRQYPHYHRGRVLERLGRFTEARDAYLTALRIQTDWDEARVALWRALTFLN